IGFSLYKYASNGIKEALSSANNLRMGIVNEIRSLTNKSYFWIRFGVAFFSRLLLAVSMSAMPFYAKYTLGLKEGDTTYLLLVMLFSGIIALFFWKKIIVKFGTKKSLFASSFLSSLAVFLVFVSSNLTE